jgi:hypothetical protein
MPRETEPQALRFPTRAQYNEKSYLDEFAKAFFDEDREDHAPRSAFAVVAALKLPKVPLGR